MPKVNQFLYFNVSSVDEEEARQEYKARIADVQSRHIAMEVPISQETGRLKRLHVGDELSAYSVDKDGNRYFFTTRVIGFREEQIRLVLIETPAPEQITKEQRREFFRVQANTELAFIVPGKAHIVAETENISGGGLAFWCGQTAGLEVGDEGACWLLLPFRNGQVEHVPFRAEVIRLRPDNQTNRTLCMAKFSDIAERERQRIIRYCFERQLENRK